MMDEFFHPPKGGPAQPHEEMEHVDPFLSRRVETRPWELRSAQYRAWALAAVTFGPEVSVSLVGRPGYPDFRGLLHLSVPFLDLEDHTRREALFLSWAGADPVLSRVPLIFVFEPHPSSVP